MPHVLIIEDDWANRLYYKKTLEDKGYEISEAVNGDEGIRLLKKMQYDLVITDIFMPVKDGIEIIFEVKRDFPDLKVIAVSGGGKCGCLDYLKMAKHMGVEKVLLKPINPNQLLEAVRDVL